MYCPRRRGDCILTQCEDWGEGTCSRWLYVDSLYELGRERNVDVCRLSMEKYSKPPEEVDNVSIFKLKEELRVVR